MASPRQHGVTPDLVCLAKSIGGGVSTAAIGGTAELMGLVADGTYEQVGTFNGNPLAMAAARAMLTEVADDAAYDHLERLGQRLETEITEIITSTNCRGTSSRAGAKGCIAFRADPIRNYRDFLGVDERLGQAHWLVQHNGGVFLPPWGKIEQWLVSVQHTDSDVDKFVANVATLADVVGRSAAVGQECEQGTPLRCERRSLNPVKDDADEGWLGLTGGSVTPAGPGAHLR